MSQTIYSHKEIQSNDIPNRRLLILPPPQKEQAGVFSLAVHDQHSDTQPCQELLKVLSGASRLTLLNKWANGRSTNHDTLLHCEVIEYIKY
jgi:hypothetical protein